MDIQTLKEKLEREHPRAVLAVKKDIAFQVGCEIEMARMRAGLTQKKLAKKIGTLQPSIARVERGDYFPSLRYLQKIAKALGGYWKFEFIDKKLTN